MKLYSEPEDDTMAVDQDQEIALSKVVPLDEKKRRIEDVKEKLRVEFQQQNSPSRKEKQDDIIVPVCQKILVKRIVDGGESQKVFLEATIIQRLLGFGFCEEENLERFDYRINGAVATDDSVFEVRRHTKLLQRQQGSHGHEMLGETYTIDARLPVELVDEFNFFPFRILRATLQLELASPSLSSGTVLRPDLWCFDENNGGVATDVLQLKKSKIQHGNKNRKGDTLLDALPQWDFVAESPERVCPPERKDDKNGTIYHAKTELTWYMTSTSLKRMLPSLAPLYLVLLLAAVNWLVHLDFEGDQDKKAHVATSVGIALTAVFLLEKILEGLDLKSLFGINDIVFLIWLGGLGISCIPERWPAACGIVLLAIAAMSPIAAYIAYRVKFQQILDRINSEYDFVEVPNEGAEKPRVSKGDCVCKRRLALV